MPNFYESTNYLQSQITKKERELEELRRKQFDAQIREFFWYIEDKMNADSHEFLDTTWGLSFMGKSIELNNYANVWETIHGLLIDYMDEDEIPYARGCDK